MAFHDCPVGLWLIYKWNWCFHCLPLLPPSSPSEAAELHTRPVVLCPDLQDGAAARFMWGVEAGWQCSDTLSGETESPAVPLAGWDVPLPTEICPRL